ncbi:signal peptidase II [bacterium]|jgi:signal peptidase II|nr:signal peptidase II [bacterium]MBT6831637.1 signal peptidase II [bacterium]MBT6996283.1 signal peptidase II [bacterium]MBT7772961.1 signal peptidase II [bacterium]
MRYLFLIFGGVILDQLSKIFARQNFDPAREVFPFFRLQFVENSGIAFSFPMARWILVPVTLVVLFFLGKFLWFSPVSKLQKIAAAFVFSGAVGNLIDRIFFGAVTDFLAFWSFPIFNLADTFVSLGIAVWIWDELSTKKSA